MKTIVERIVDLLVQDCWKGFPELRHCLAQARTRADHHVLAGLAGDPRLRSRSDFAQRSIRVAVAGSFSTENLRDPITLQFLDRGLFCEQYHVPFGQLGREVRKPESGLYLSRPDMVVLIPDVRDHLPGDATLSEVSVRALVQAVSQDLASLRRHFSGPVLVQNFVSPESRPFGLLDCKQNLGVADFFRLANLRLSQRLATEADVFVLDAAHLVTFCATAWVRLHKPNFLGGCLLPDELTGQLAAEVAAAGAALKGFARKCLVVDLDNTLWGGVVGEDGVSGIQLAGAFPGNVYNALQCEIRALRERGVVLAINSKNNEQDVWEVFASRGEMVLRREHFSCARINWRDKASNLREIAADLNLGLEAMVVLDDDAAEQQWIETSHPEVYVVPAADPLHMLRFLATTRLFDTFAVGDDDSLRLHSYAARDARKKLQEDADDLNAFLHSLQLVVEIAVPTSAQMGRVAQLTQKTNQFNLTTRRYSESQLRQMLQTDCWNIFCCSCRDRFADEGLVGVAIIRASKDAWEIDTLLLSCRALGRGVEQAFLADLCFRAERAGMHRVRGEFIPSAKNGQTELFYQQNGFGTVSADGTRFLWELSLPVGRPLWPAWIRHPSQMTTAVEA